MLTAHPKVTQFIISVHDMTDDILISGVEQKKNQIYLKNESQLESLVF